jgi:hypothetical protein
MKPGFLSLPVITFLLSPNIPFSTLFSSIFSSRSLWGPPPSRTLTREAEEVFVSAWKRIVS